MFSVPCESTRALLGVVQSHRTQLLCQLRRAYPRACEGQVEDALQVACLAVLEKPEGFVVAAQTDSATFLRRVGTVAWRHLRGEWRRAEHQRARVQVTELDPPGPYPTPEEGAAGTELLDLLEGLVPEAARRLGGGKSESVEAALWYRVLLNTSDAHAARLHGVPREYINRTRRWLAARLVVRGQGRD